MIRKHTLYRKKGGRGEKGPYPRGVIQACHVCDWEPPEPPFRKLNGTDKNVIQRYECVDKCFLLLASHHIYVPIFLGS